MLQSFFSFKHPQISPANQKKTHHYSSFRLRGSSSCFLPRSQIIIELHKGRVRAFGVGLYILYYQDDSLKVKIPLRVQIRPQHHRKIEEGEVAQYLYLVQWKNGSFCLFLGSCLIQMHPQTHSSWSNDPLTPSLLHPLSLFITIQKN